METPGRENAATVPRAIAVALRLIVVAAALACATTHPPRGSAAAGGVEPERVRAARREQAPALQRMFRAARVGYPARLLIVAFKRERRLELWGFSHQSGRYVRVASYPFLASSGELGPKRRSGDHQIPEGFYLVTLLNPASLYHLSLELDYPNAADRILGDARDPGSEIFIHGGAASDGCIPIGNRAIEQLYRAVLDSRSSGYRVPVEVFPCRFSDPQCRALLGREDRDRPALAAFWADLAEGYELLARSGSPPVVVVDPLGRYRFGDQERHARGGRSARGSSSD